MKKIKFLAAKQDADKLNDLIAELEKRGIKTAKAGDDLNKNDLVLVAMSESLYADEASVARVMKLVDDGAKYILPLRLDSAEIPQTFKSAIYVRNMIPAGDRNAAQLAERIISALPKEKNNLPKIIAAAAVVVVALAAVFMLRGGEEKTVPAMSTESPIAIPAGLTQEDLENINGVVIVGDHFSYYTSTNHYYENLWKYANDSFDDDGRHWYSTEDGHEFKMTRYDDLRFLSLMPKLQNLDLALVDAGMLPKLSESKWLSSVTIFDCTVDNLDWLSDSAIERLNISYCPVTDFSPLTSCYRFTELRANLTNNLPVSFTGFAPETLNTLDVEFNNNGTADFSGLASCEKLQSVYLHGGEFENLDFIKDRESVQYIGINNASRLRDVSALGTLPKLYSLEIRECRNLRDISAVAANKELNKIALHENENLADVSALENLTKLKEIELLSCAVRDLEFLKGLTGNGKISLTICNVGDVSGLSYIKNYNRLSINTWNMWDESRSLAPYYEYFEGASVGELALYDCRDIDLAKLPEVTGKLEIYYGDLTDLSAMPEWEIKELVLCDLQRLTNLDGIQNLSKLGKNGIGVLEIDGCPRLTDWTALAGLNFARVDLKGTYDLPDFSTFMLKKLRVDSAVDVENIDFLAGLDREGQYLAFELVGLENVRDISLVREFRVRALAVSPELMEQAQELLDDGIIETFDIDYPDGEWQPYDGGIEILSLDDLYNLPRSVLHHVERLNIAGNTVFDYENAEINEEWENDEPVPVLCDRATNTERWIERGSIADFSVFAELTNLRELTLANQPIESLEGIQALENLESLNLMFCDKLTDVSAAFTLQNLHYLNFRNSAVASIQGIQNLDRLESLDIFHTKVEDLSPLAGVDFSAAGEGEGFRLELADTVPENLSSLAAVPRYAWLCINNIPSELWLTHLENSEIYAMACCGAQFSDESFADFVRSHHELRELHIPWNEELTDISALLELEGLEYVKVSDNMEDAIASLGGDCGFELEIEG